MAVDPRAALIDPRRERAGFLNGMWLKATGRSWWRAKYTDGRTLEEWQTLKDPKDPTSSRWEDVDRRNLRELTLLCPNGEGGTVSARGDYKLFQLKQGIVSPGLGRVVIAHMIGVVTDANGNCDCFAWDVEAKRLDGPFADNVLNMRFGNIGALGLVNVGLVL